MSFQRDVATFSTVHNFFFFLIFVSNLSIPRLSQLPKDSDSSKASCRMKGGKDPEIRLKNWRGSPRRPASTSVGSPPPPPFHFLFHFFKQPPANFNRIDIATHFAQKTLIPQHEEMRRNTAGGAKKIALSAIKTLTFYADKYTAGRRTDPIREFFYRASMWLNRQKRIILTSTHLALPIAQLTCKGPGCKVFQPDVVQCTNMGDDGLGNVQWKVCFFFLFFFLFFQATVYICWL